jgi:ribosome maturation factor RimP
MGDSLEGLRATAERVARSHGLELFDVQFRRESTGWVLRVILDRVPPAEESARGPREEPAPPTRHPGMGGRSESAPAAGAGVGPAGGPASGNGAPLGTIHDAVGIEDCQQVSHDLSALLDVDEERLGLPDVKYTLEVSSPGLDRPLRGEADYRRVQGRLAKIVTSEPVAGQSSFSGRLAGLDGGDVLLGEGRRTHRIPVRLIKRARLDVEF